MDTIAHERVIVFIDRSNLDFSFRRCDTSGKKIDYVRLIDHLRNGRMIRQVRLYYSDYLDISVVPEMDRSEWGRRQDFYTFLKYHGFHLCPVRRREGTVKEKELDTRLTRDMERLCHDGRCDTIILVSGDGDYCDVVGGVQNDYAIKVEVAFFEPYTAKDLRSKSSKFIDLGSNLDKLLRNPIKGE